jgi:hypothetical protein
MLKSRVRGILSESVNFVEPFEGCLVLAVLLLLLLPLLMLVAVLVLLQKLQYKNTVCEQIVIECCALKRKSNQNSADTNTKTNFVVCS